MDVTFVGLTEEICEEAWSIVWPTVKSAARRGITNKDAGHILVLNPAIPYEPKYLTAMNKGWEQKNSIRDLVLWCDTFGDPDEHPVMTYVDIARRKGFVSYLTGLPSHQVQQQFPTLYVPGMTKWGGSAVAGVGPMRLITSFSGVQWNFDQMIAEMLISAIQALCHEEMREVMASDDPVIQPQWVGC